MGCSGSSQQQIQQINWFSPLEVGEIKCKNRIFMAPMTRCRADPSTSVPSDLMATYYSQRADFGLIITECSQISQRGGTIPGSGGIYTDEQVKGWKNVCDQVHQKGGNIILQLWHCGRNGHTKLNGGLELWGPSPIGLKDPHPHLKENYPIPHEMTVDEIKTVIKEHRTGAENAKKAGFDGVQVQFGNGYLIDQFIRDYSNQRKDQYGGSVENRCRFALEVIDEVIQVFGKGRVGVRITPVGRYGEMFDSNPLDTFKFLLKKLDERGIAFVELKEASSSDKQLEGKPTGKEQMQDVASTLRSFFHGVFISNESFTPKTGLELIQQGISQAITFGKLAINNPDLPYRIKNNLELNTNYDFNTFFAGGENGYTNIPTFEDYIDWSTPLKMGDIQCNNRVVMAPMTRCRADPSNGVPNDLMATYYSQRAGFGLIITECSQISQRGSCYPGSGGCYTKEQTIGWQKVVDAVHQKGGKIVLQIWHSGRVTHPKLNGNLEPWAPSAIKINEKHNYLNEDYPVPHEMTQNEINEVINEFKAAAQNAKVAGFDGLELAAANGFLVDQFLRDGTNQRKDIYGGNAENRCRFALEVIDALISVFGAGRVGIRISPVGRFQEMFDSNPLETYSFLLQQLDQRKIAFVEIKEPNDDKSHKNDLPSGKEQMADAAELLRPHFSGVFINNEGFNQENGIKKLKKGVVQAISFAKLAINNPDLPSRFQNKYPLNTDYKFDFFFGGGQNGYTDFPQYIQ